MRFASASWLGLMRLLSACPRVAAGLASAISLPAFAEGGPTQVDVELALAVDVSYSMDVEEQRLQRAGYVEAFRSRAFADALKSGVHGKIAVAYVEWAGAGDQWVVVPFTLIDSPQAAAAFAEKIAAAPQRRWRRTSISGALDAVTMLFAGNGFDGARRVIDISGDGPNNDGRPVTRARDEALAAGFVINGLPLLLKRPSGGWGEIDDLDVYYEDCVTGGPGSFVLPVRDHAQFIDATRTKIVMEIAAAPPPLIAPVRFTPARADPPRVDCLIGEKMWRQRWDN